MQRLDWGRRQMVPLFGSIEIFEFSRDELCEYITPLYASVHVTPSDALPLLHMYIRCTRRRAENAMWPFTDHGIAGQNASRVQETGSAEWFDYVSRTPKRCTCTASTEVGGYYGA